MTSFSQQLALCSRDMPTRNIFFIVRSRNSLFHLGVLSHTSWGSQGYYLPPVQFSDLTLIWLIWGTLLPSGTRKALKSLAVTLLFLSHVWMPRDELVAETSVSVPLAEAAAECHKKFPVRCRHLRAQERSSRLRPPGCSGVPEFLQQQEVETWAAGPAGPRAAWGAPASASLRPCPGRWFIPCTLPPSSAELCGLSFLCKYCLICGELQVRDLIC